MPAGTEIERRSRARVAFALPTGARGSALASMKLKPVDLAAGSVLLDARDVKTGFGKTFTTFFVPAGAEVRQIADEWVFDLRRERLWSLDDPLYPATRVGLGARLHFEVVGTERKAWAPAAPFRAIFRRPLRRRDCRTTTRTACTARWCCSAGPCAGRPRTSRPGARTSGMSGC